MILEKKVSTAKGTLHFIYEGEPKKQNFNKEKITALLDKIFDNIYFQNDIIRVVMYLRTIFRDCEERYILVETNVDGVIRDVRYCNGNLRQYSNFNHFINGNNIFKFYYDTDNGGNFSFSNDSEIKNYGLFENEFKKFVNVEMDYLLILKNGVKAVKLDREGKAIIAAYKLFYGELPDLSDLQVETKMHNMLYILEECGISVQIKGEELYFACYDKYPQSMRLFEWLQSVLPLATNVEIYEISKLNKESVEIIRKIGEEIEKSFKTSQIEKASFERFCYVLYCSKYRYRSNITLRELAEKIKNDYFASFSEEEIQFYIELTANINKLL